MEIPALFHGLYDEVASRCDGVVERLAAGESWSDVIRGPMLDTHQSSGLLILNGPSPLLGGSPHFHCYLPHFRIRDAIGRAQLRSGADAVTFNASLQSASGILGLLSPANVMWVHSRERYVPFLKASLRYWELLAGEGPRYSTGLPTGESFSIVQNNVRFVLANLGVPTAVAGGPLSADRLAELVDELDAS